MNFDSLVTGGYYLQGTGFFDVLVNPIMFLLAFMPFILGRNFFSNLEDTEYMFKVLGVLALIYTLPMLWELRFSPQLHLHTFGYFPGDFIQQVRGDGYRPMVFIGHGLSLSFWFSTCIIAVLTLYRAKVKPFGWTLIIYLFVVLLLCKTVSAVIYVTFAALLMFFLSPKKQLLVSLIAAAFVMVYPFNATSQFVKNQDMIDYVKTYNADRAQSIETRFTNEERLVKRALERPYFGWSSWGRNRVYENGNDITIADGRWIIILGVNGIVGFILFFSLLLYPIRQAMKCYKFIENKKHGLYFLSLVIILAIGVVDSVPNAGMLPMHLLLAGALLGQCETIKAKQRELRLQKMKERLSSLRKP